MHSGQVDMTRAWTGMAPLARCRHAGIRVTAGEKALIPLYMYFSDFLTCISLILKTIFLRFEKRYFAYYDLCRYGTRSGEGAAAGTDGGVRVTAGEGGGESKSTQAPTSVRRCTSHRAHIHPPTSSSVCRLENLETDRMPS